MGRERGYKVSRQDSIMYDYIVQYTNKSWAGRVISLYALEGSVSAFCDVDRIAKMCVIKHLMWSDEKIRIAYGHLVVKDHRAS